MSTVWTAVIAVGAATILLKATGPLLLGPRTLPPRLMGLVALLAPALLAALVVTQAVGGNRSIVIDARLPGLAAGAVAAFLRAPLLAVIVIAAATTALARALT